MLEIREGTSLQWQCPVFEGTTPSPRESHAAVTFGNRLVIYGGMNGHRLSDVWVLDVGKGEVMLLVKVGDGKLGGAQTEGGSQERLGERVGEGRLGGAHFNSSLLPQCGRGGYWSMGPGA